MGMYQSLQECVYDITVWYCSLPIEYHQEKNRGRVYHLYHCVHEGYSLMNVVSALILGLIAFLKP